MTVASLSSMFFALFWCALVFASAVGWGSLCVRCAGVRQASLAMRCVAGLGLLAFAGGVLNLLALLYSAVLTSMVVCGAVLALAFAMGGTKSAWRWPGVRSRTAGGLLLVFCALLVLRGVSTVHRTEYMGLDDYEAYLVFPAKMLQLHHFAADPFNERRIQSSIGVAYFLQELVLTKLPLECTQMLDGGVGLLLLACTPFALRRAFGLSQQQTWVLAVAAIAMPHIRFNLTMTTLPGALLLAAAAVAADAELRESHRVARASLLGAAGAVVIGAKSTYLPHVFFFGAALYTLEWREHGGGRRAAAEFTAAALACVALLAPWCVAMRHTSGTYFFPLGHGYDYTSYYHLPRTSTFTRPIERLKVIAFVLPLLPFLLLQLRSWRRRGGFDSVPLAMTTAAMLGTLVTGWATGGDSLRRYNYPCILPALLLILVWTMRESCLGDVRRRRTLLAATAALLVFWAGYMLAWENVYGEMPRDFATSMRPRKIAPAEVQREYTALGRALDTALSRDGAVLETLDYPFLLDFRTHSILSADFPGTASLPPGWPIEGGGDALARYLAAHGIRYLAYAYGDQAFLSDEECVAAQSNPTATQAWKNILFLIHRAHQQYGELARTRRHVFDDGKIYVLDLTQPGSGALERSALSQ